MRIAVCVKQVPDPQAPAGSFYIDEAANEPRWSPPAEAVISTFDLHAIEAAARLRDEAGAEIVVVTVGPAAAEVALRRALAAGADRAVRVEPSAAPTGDRLAVATALAAAIRRLESVDLVLCGRIAADWDMGHVPGMLAACLGLEAITPVVGLRPAGAGVVVERLTDDGREEIEADLPCLLAVSNELNEPRYPTLRAVLEAQRKPVVAWSTADLGLDPVTPLVGLARLVAPGLDRACNLVEADSPAEAGRLLADLLHETVLA